MIEGPASGLDGLVGVFDLVVHGLDLVVEHAVGGSDGGEGEVPDGEEGPAVEGEVLHGGIGPPGLFEIDVRHVVPVEVEALHGVAGVRDDVELDEIEGGVGGGDGIGDHGRAVPVSPALEIGDLRAEAFLDGGVALVDGVVDALAVHFLGDDVFLAAGGFGADDGEGLPVEIGLGKIVAHEHPLLRRGEFLFLPTVSLPGIGGRGGSPRTGGRRFGGGLAASGKGGKREDQHEEGEQDGGDRTEVFHGFLLNHDIAEYSRTG